jgi:hypothetical protein
MDDDKFSREEAELRLRAALRGARMVDHKPQSEMKFGKPRAKLRKSPTPKKKRPPGGVPSGPVGRRPSVKP